KKWRTSKPTSVWAGSTFQVAGAAAVGRATVRAAMRRASGWSAGFIMAILLRGGEAGGNLERATFHTFDWEQLVKARTIDRPLTCVLTRNCTSRDVPDTYGPGHRTPRAAASRTPSGSGGHFERRAMPLELGNAGPALHDQLGEEPARERAELEAVARADRPHHHVRMARERADHEPL